jgi:predicted MFS family arabinose efflux permease
MMTVNTGLGRTVLALVFVAGMIDMVALPVWVGALMAHYQYSPPQAGITVTVFLLGVVLSSLFFAPKFNRLNQRLVATLGFALAALAFAGASLQPTVVASFGVLVGLHFVAGLGVGAGLSATHGSIGRSHNPHRLWAMSNVALGVFAVVFLGGMPKLIQTIGAAVLFQGYAALMLLACVIANLLFPKIDAASAQKLDGQLATKKPIPRAAWYVVGVVICLTINQAMVFSFVERIGAAHGFSVAQVTSVLIALGLVNLLPGVLAAGLQTKLSPFVVGIAGPIGQAVLALTMTLSVGFAPYAVAAALYVAMVIFTHTFLFGVLAKLDTSGRTVAATPAMMMTGSCIGPAIGGALIQAFGYPGLAYAACVVSFIAVMLMIQERRSHD